MTKLLHGTSTPKPTHTKNAVRAEPLLNCLLNSLVRHWNIVLLYKCTRAKTPDQTPQRNQESDNKNYSL